MTQQAAHERWTYRGVDQNGTEVATQEFGDTGEALDWFRDRLTGDVNEIQVSRWSDEGTEEYVTTLRYDKSAD